MYTKLFFLVSPFVGEVCLLLSIGRLREEPGPTDASTHSIRISSSFEPNGVQNRA